MVSAFFVFCPIGIAGVRGAQGGIPRFLWIKGWVLTQHELAANLCPDDPDKEEATAGKCGYLTWWNNLLVHFYYIIKWGVHPDT